MLVRVTTAIFFIALGGFFVWSAGAKIADPTATITVLGQGLGMPPWISRAATSVVVAVESTLGVWLVSGVRERVAGGVAGLLLSAFSVALLLLLASGFDGDCGCGVAPLRIPDALVRNAMFLGLLGVALWASREATRHPNTGRSS